jgi:hypothetical protein
MRSLRSRDALITSNFVLASLALTLSFRYPSPCLALVSLALQWVLQMSVKFVDICKTIALTTEHLGNWKAFDIFSMIATAGLIGLQMLVDRVTIEALVIVAVTLFFSISNIMDAVATNKQLKRVRALSWDCYGELMSHSLLFKGEEDVEAGSSLSYKQIVNSAKHLLNIIQTSREGLKFGDVEYVRAKRAQRRAMPSQNHMRPQMRSAAHAPSPPPRPARSRLGAPN